LIHSADVVDWVQYLTAFQIDALAKGFDNPPENGAYPQLWTTGSNGTNVQYAQYAWKLAKRGFRYVQVVQPVLRVQRILPFGSSLSFYGTNLFSYYSKSSLYSVIGIPNEYYNIMPQGTDPSSAYTDGLGYYYGWQKLPPTIQDQTGNTILVVQDYAYGLYPYLLFGTRL
jgi:hypothetical protein